MKKILVTGSGGQLGECLKVAAGRRAHTSIVFVTEAEGNILDSEALRELFILHRPDYIINCAAYTAVDLAEDELDQAAQINVEGARNIALICAEMGITLIHISTDFVFEGASVKLLTEEDLTNPVSTYGQTKLDGETAISAVLAQHFIVRTSWLYSEYGNNFVKTMLRLGETRKELNIVADQIGSPTYAIDLANALLDMAFSDSHAYGIYHYSNEGAISWFDFAQAIFSISKSGMTVNAIPGSAYPAKAKRPGFSVMDKSKIRNTFSLKIPYWRDSLEVCMANLSE